MLASELAADLLRLVRQHGDYEVVLHVESSYHTETPLPYFEPEVRREHKELAPWGNQLPTTDYQVSPPQFVIEASA